MVDLSDNKESKLNVYQGTSNFFQEEKEFEKQLSGLKDKIREFFNLKNVNFLFGSGTSNGAISTMSKLFETLSFDKEEKDLESEFKRIKAKEGEDLEKCLSVVYAARAYSNGIMPNDEKEERENKKAKDLYDRLLNKIERHIFESINIGFNKDEETKVMGYYKTFYQKLALRNKDNSRIRVFTTNNDLFNEMAMDALNIHYINGFSGGLQRCFNPAIFNYTWSKRMDTSIDKYEPVENMVYLYKIHGSINWRETNNFTNNYFEIEEVGRNDIRYDQSVLIYPTPTKQDKSLGSPYVDLFREFQNKLLEPHSVLFVIGYSFSDRHVNDIIYRALATNSTINVVIFGSIPDKKYRKDKPIFFIDDNRIFKIWGEVYDKDGNKQVVNHFDYIVNNLLPNLDTFRKDEDILSNFVMRLKEEKSKASEK